MRLVPFERDPEAYLAVRPLRLELDALLRMHAAATAAEPSPLAGPGLANGAERLEALQSEAAKADALAASLLMIGNLAPREDLDFVERLWLLAKGACVHAWMGRGREEAPGPTRQACVRGGEGSGGGRGG